MTRCGGTRSRSAPSSVMLPAGKITEATIDSLSQLMRPGDVITCPIGKKHWHGASPTAAMTHMAIQESLDDKNVEWLEKVTDEQYLSDLTDAK